MALSGPPGAGKSTHSSYLASTFHFQPVEGSDCIRGAARQMGRPLDKPSDYEDIVRELQVDISPSWIADNVLAQGGDRPLHVGLRTEYDFYRIKQAGGLIVALTALPTVCRRRINEIAPDRFHSEDTYQKQIDLETSGDEYGSNTPWVIDHADCQIDTSEMSVPQTRGELESIVMARWGALALEPLD
jgi:hypothetical protein